MIFNKYDRTPRIKTKPWIKAMLISCYALLITVFLFMGTVMSIEARSIFPFLITFLSISFFALVILARIYDMCKAYIEIENETIKVTDYPFFKKRERFFALRDIKRVKWEGGGGPGAMPLLALKNDQNKTLFRIIYAPETIAYFESLGFQIEY